MEKIAPTTALRMAEHWTERAERFNGAASHIRHADQWRDLFRAALGEIPCDVLDLGTGTGACALALADLGHRVTAVDGSAGMLAFAREEARHRGHAITFVEATMDDAILSEGAYDIVTIRNVLWTLEVPSAAIALAWRALRPGGVLLVSDGQWRTAGSPSDLPELYADLPFANGLTEQDALTLLYDGGFIDPHSWQAMFPSNPYEAMGDPAFFVLTASKPSL
jgi:ubiquinone/menaquinone biosynthesis C-methylase UbiE